MFLSHLASLQMKAMQTDKTPPMQHMKTRKDLALIWLFTFAFFAFGLGENVEANSKSKPIEILSDPFGYGVPTHYTVLRGHTKATFSHPMFGQFTRAEIVQREKDGYRTTRFALTPDGKSYQPVMIQFRAFETYGYPKEDDHCVNPSLAVSPLSTVKALGPAVKEGELIAIRRKKLAESRFFDASCFEPSVSEDHRNAIFNAAADVLTPDLQDKGEFPKYLRCLERNGLADESGVIQGHIQQVLNDSAMAPKLKLSCTTDKKAKPGQYSEKSRVMSLRLVPKPDRDTYAQLLFHELLHTVPIRDGLLLDQIEECCTSGEQCSELQSAAIRLKSEEKVMSVLASKSTLAQTADAASIVLAGTKLSRSFGEKEVTSSCVAIGQSECRKSEQLASAFLDSQSHCPIKSEKPSVSFLNLFPAAQASMTCSNEEIAVVHPDLLDSVRRAQAQEGRATLAEVARTTPVTSPILWERPAEEVQQPSVPIGGLASRSATGGGRTIASIASIPEPSSAKLGSTKGRRDVAQYNRATVLVDTLERAANSVTKHLTFERLDARKVEPTEVFRSAGKDSEKSMFVVASLADRPFQISNVADVKGLSFPNPFAKTESRGLAKVVDQNGAPVIPTQTESLVSVDSVDLGTGAIAGVTAGIANSRAVQTASSQPFSLKGDRSPSKTSAPDFENMSQSDLKKFLVGSYRQVAEFLEDRKFVLALSKNGIQIYDHENRKIGASKATMVEGQMRHTIFIYSAEKSRLIQSRTAGREQTQ